jgi:hypothetical protein
MTPLLNHLQAQLIAAQLPGMSRENLVLYLTEAQPRYATPYDPEGLLPPDAPIEMELTPPITLLIKPYGGDLLDLIMVLNLILDDLAPASRGNDQRFTVSAEPLDNRESVVVITLALRERIRYIPATDGNLMINGRYYRREALPVRPEPQPLNTVRYVG